MYQTVQSSFNAQCPVEDCIKSIIGCGDSAYNNFVYGVNQNIDYFSFIKSKAGIASDCNLDLLTNAVNKLSTTPCSAINEVKNYINNTTIINEDIWSSLQW